MPSYDAETLREVGRRAFEAVGAPESTAKRVADALIDGAQSC